MCFFRLLNFRTEIENNPRGKKYIWWVLFSCPLCFNGIKTIAPKIIWERERAHKKTTEKKRNWVILLEWRDAVTPISKTATTTTTTCALDKKKKERKKWTETKPNETKKKSQWKSTLLRRNIRRIDSISFLFSTVYISFCCCFYKFLSAIPVRSSANRIFSL